MPETLFDGPDEDNTNSSVVQDVIEKDEMPILEPEPFEPPSMAFRDYLHRLWLWDLDRPPSRRLKATDFVVKPLSMLKYPSVAFPALY